MISEGHARGSGGGGASLSVQDIPCSRKWPRRLDRWTHRHQDRRQGSEASHLVGYLSLLSLPHEISVAETGSLSGLWGEGWACVLRGPFTRGRKIIQTLRFACRPSSFRHNGLPLADPLLKGNLWFLGPRAEPVLLEGAHDPSYGIGSAFAVSGARSGALAKRECTRHPHPLSASSHLCVGPGRWSGRQETRLILQVPLSRDSLWPGCSLPQVRLPGCLARAIAGSPESTRPPTEAPGAEHLLPPRLCRDQGTTGRASFKSA